MTIVLGLRRTRTALLLLATALLCSALVVPTASAHHPWSDYHWARDVDDASVFEPFAHPIKLGDNVASTWDGDLATTAGDWRVDPYTGTDWLGDQTDKTIRNPVRTNVVSGLTTPKRCRATSGRVEVCSERYGRTGWLGVAQIWLSGGHITQGTAKLNDTYLASSKYQAFRLPVMCQEVGHTFGLGHQDESGADWHTCMDYSRSPHEHNGHPNFHDYEQLTAIYAHDDAMTTIDSSTETLASKGAAVPYRIDRRNGARSSTIVEHFADNSKKITHIRWASER